LNKESLIAGFAIFILLLFFLSNVSSLTGNVVLENGEAAGEEIHEVYKFEFTQIILVIILLTVIVWYYYSR